MTAQMPLAGGAFEVAAQPDLWFCKTEDTAVVRYLDSFAKRAVDVSLSLALLLFLSPLLVLIATAIAVDSKGPVLYRQQRFGRGGVPFWILKFRSMRACEDAGSFKQATRGDSRITRVGRFIRATSLDELPQLFNVLAGEMRLVGPRPLPDYHLAAMEGPFQARRRSVMPGLTGLWQISERSAADLSRLQQLDEFYLENKSFWFDLHILLKTAPAVLRGDGAY